MKNIKSFKELLQRKQKVMDKIATDTEMTHQEILSSLEQILYECTYYHKDGKCQVLKKHQACLMILDFIKTPKMKEFIGKTQDV